MEALYPPIRNKLTQAAKLSAHLLPSLKMYEKLNCIPFIESKALFHCFRNFQGTKELLEKAFEVSKEFVSTQ